MVVKVTGAEREQKGPDRLPQCQIKLVNSPQAECGDNVMLAGHTIVMATFPTKCYLHTEVEQKALIKL